MTGYLVLLRHLMDDFPLAMCCSREEALIFAGEVDWYPSQEMVQRVGFPDASTPVSVCLVRFIGGRPVRVEKVRDFEEEEDCEEEAVMADIHERRCYDCGHIQVCAERIIPYITCEKCKSNDTRATKRVGLETMVSIQERDAAIARAEAAEARMRELKKSTHLQYATPPHLVIDVSKMVAIAKRLEKAEQLLQRAYNGMHKDHWEEGESECEVCQSICDFLDGKESRLSALQWRPIAEYDAMAEKPEAGSVVFVRNPFRWAVSWHRDADYHTHFLQLPPVPGEG